MEVIPGSGGSMPFQRHNVEEWSHLDSLTGMLEHARVETGHWSANTSNTSHKYGKVVDSRARNLADGSVQQRQRKQLEVFQAQVPGGSLQVIRTQSVTSTSSSRTIHGNNISSDFENLQLNLNPLDLSTQKTKASVGRSGSISSRRPPSRPRSLINKPTSAISEDNSFLAAEKQDVESRLSEVSRLCQQFHDEAKKNISKGGITPSIVSIGNGEQFAKDNDKSTSSLGNKEEIFSNGHTHSVLIRKKSCSTEDLQNNEHDGEEKSSEDTGMMADWKRASKVRRSLQFPSKGSQLDLIPNGNVSKICKEIEGSRKDNTMKNTTSNFESLENILRSGSLMKNKLLNENNLHSNNSNMTDKSENEPEAFTRRINPIKTAPQKRHSFVTVESLKEVRGRLRRLSSPPLDGIQHATATKATDDSDDGIETEESNKATPDIDPKPTENIANSQVKTYMYGMSALNNGIHNNIRKPVPGTGSLESRTSNRSSSSSGSRSEEWYNRRKSYGFEQVHGHQNGNQPRSMSFQDKNRVESSTDSGICRSSETVTASSWSQLFGRPKDEVKDSSGSIKVSHSIQIKKFGNERDSSDSDSRGTQKGRRTVVTLGSEGNAKNIDSGLKESTMKTLNSWKNELSHVPSYATDKSIRCLSEPVTVSIPIVSDDSFNGADINGNVDSKRIYFRQLSEGTNVSVESVRRKSGSLLENGSSEKNLSDETKSLAARRELLMKHRAAQETGMPFRPWAVNGRLYSSRQGDTEIKRHSIAVDETKYVKNDLHHMQKDDYFSYDSGFSTSTKSIPDFENGDCKISVDFRSASATVEDDDDDECSLQQLAGKKQKKVEFCKTEVHFAAEPGRFNIVETDEKPPPTNMFRRRRRNSICNLTTPQAQEANKSSLPEIRFGDSLYEKKLLGGTESNAPGALSLDSSLNSTFGLKRAEPVIIPSFQHVADKDDIIYTQANATILASVRQEESTAYNDLEEISGDSMQSVNSRPRSILKNNRRPRPFHLGETEDESFLANLGDKSLEPETRWGIRLKPVQNKETAMWRSTISLQSSTFENQQQQQSFTQVEEKLPKQATSLQNSKDETELQKLLKSLRPASQRKSTGDVFLSPEPTENGVEIKISMPSPVQPASWSVAERVRQVEDWKHGSLEARGYSTRVNFGAGEATVVESDSQQRHATPSVTLYQPNNQRKPVWLRREERKMEAAGKTEVSAPAKLKDCRDAAFQRSVATAKVESYNDSNRLRAVETLISTRFGHPKITSISLRYEGDEHENLSTSNKTRHSEYATPNLSSSQDNFSSLQASNKNYLHISEPIVSPTYPSSDLKQRGLNKETFHIQKTKEKSPERKLSAAEERNYENINPRTPERKSNSFSLDQSIATSLKRRSFPEYENTVSLFNKDNPQKISMDFAVKNDLKTPDKSTSIKTNTYVKETKRQSTSSYSSRHQLSQQQQQRKISLSSLESPSDHSPTRKETNVEVRKRLYHPRSEESRKQSVTVTKSVSSAKQEKNATVNLSHRERDKNVTKMIRDRSRSPSKTITPQSKHKEVTESHIYENIIPSLKTSRTDGVETESVILEELTRAADQILQAVNGYTDEESYKASSDDDDEHDDNFRGGRRRGKRCQVRKVSGNLGTISESPSLKKQQETENSTESRKINDHNKRNQRLPKTRLGPTSSTSSIESFTKEVIRSSLNHSQEQRKSKISTANGAVKSSARSARLLQRASSRELLLQTYGSSSEDGGSIRKPSVPRRSRHNSVITKTDSVSTNAKKTSAESQQSPVVKARQRKRDANTTKPKERLCGSTNKTAPLAKKASGGDSGTKSRSSRSRDEDKHWRGSSHPSSRRETSDLRHRAQGGGIAVGEATGHDKTERAIVSERRVGGATKSPAATCVVTKKKPTLASSHNGSPQAKSTK